VSSAGECDLEASIDFSLPFVLQCMTKGGILYDYIGSFE